MKKVTEEEFKEIQTLRDSLFTILASIGELHLGKMLLEKQIDDINSQTQEQEKKFEEFQQKERVLFEQLQQKYGAGSIDMETGEITE
jgi:hypothetical protein